MKIREIAVVESRDGLDVGTYVALRVESEDAKMLRHFCEDMEIPNHLDKNLFHMTVFTSKDNDPEFNEEGTLTENVIGSDLRLSIWEGDDNRMLVVEMECEAAVERHSEISEETDMKPIYKELKPHVTLSYDIGDEEWELDRMSYRLREYLDVIRFDHEYCEPLSSDKYKDGKDDFKK